MENKKPTYSDETQAVVLNENTEVLDATGYVNTVELNDLIKAEEAEKKLPWYKKIFKRKNKKK